ncbi:hypothetical protein MA16_Dca008803 [Dendrobium catenatum]|uniref:Uncharacterized protein n=1 Tax=Dendrobium catenatum TaxID=906689 RepID=A0A2I0VY26_9ASPA|nr:hypothetical protein MA16_Dca008803 [Dendrobium catenatum]
MDQEPSPAELRFPVACMNQELPRSPSCLLLAIHNICKIPCSICQQKLFSDRPLRK